MCQEAKSSDNILTPAFTALTSEASSPGGKFVQVPLGSTWSEAVEALKLGLGVPENRRVEVRRLMSLYDDHGVQSRSFLNGDVVELSVVDDGAWFEASDNFGIGEQKLYGGVEPSKEAMAVPSPAAAWRQPTLETLRNSTRSRSDDHTRLPHVAVFGPIRHGDVKAPHASSVVKTDVPWKHKKPPEQLTAERSSISTSANAEEEAAVAELVGMGFGREHVVEALRGCGRGDDWKEAAISVLLEPQMSGVGVDPEVGVKKPVGTVPHR